MATIDLKTEVPGPRSRAMTARRDAALPSGVARSTEVALASGRGAVLTDVDGNTLLDFAGGIGMLNVGHCDPDVVEAASRQARELVHACALVATFEPPVALAEALNELTPGDFPKKTLLTNSGAEAVENAVKVARSFTGRPGVVCFEGGYHGRTLLTLGLTSKYALFKKGFGPFPAEITRLPAPNPYRPPPGMDRETAEAWAIDRLEHAFTAQVDPSAVAAVLIEPVQGEAGFLPMPASFLRRIRELCDQHGMLMIADEVQSGFGRTGRVFAIEHYDVVPDLVTMAKSLGAGFPIGAVTGRAEVMDSTHLGGLGGTYGGSPVACAAALEVVRKVRDPAFLARATRLGEVMQETLEGWKAEVPELGDVRGLGAMRLLELVVDREGKAPNPALASTTVKEAMRRGLVMIRAGLYSNCVRLLPPLVITDEQLAEGLDVLGQALRAAREAAA